MGAKKLALKAMRAVNKIEADEETKWLDIAYDVNGAGGAPLCLPFTSTDQSTSVHHLTPIQPRQSVNTTLGAGLPTINTSNYRDGARVYLSGVYLKAQFYWPQIRDTTTFRYPPFANISWMVVRQIKNNSAIDPYTPTVFPDPKDILQVPDQFSQTLVPWTQDEAPLSSLLFRNMNNGHNYKILRRGTFMLAAPTMCQQGPAVNTANLSQSSYGSITGPAGPNNQTLPHQFSNNACKTISVKLHPKLKVRYRQLPENVNEQTAVTNEQVVPLENGLYFMFWSDVGSHNGDSRFYSWDQATYDIITPRVFLNSRVRFKDV
ncbi:MAG TPA: hypothetical protein EYN67_17030 [Flavobacteriales bacterium]|nr:hypothetical protein [Flavobacteriales bacterium]